MRGEDIRIEVLSDPRLLGSIRGLVRSYVSAFGVSAERAENVVLAVDEACANSIRHAFNGRRDRKIEITLRSNRRWVEIVVRDGGKPAPRERLTRTGPKRLDRDNLKPGGLGVQLIYRAFDQVGFSTGRTRGNCVTMKLKRPAARRT